MGKFTTDQPGSRNCVPSGGPFSILVVDDEASARELLRGLLTRHGHAVIEAATGEEAWDAFRREEPDVVLCDVRMPGLGGLGLLERIRRVSAEAEVVLVTGFADTELVIRALRAGASNFVEKSAGAAELIRQLEPSFIRCGLRAETVRLRQELERMRGRGPGPEVRPSLDLLEQNARRARDLLARCIGETGSGLGELDRLLQEIAGAAGYLRDALGAGRHGGPMYAETPAAGTGGEGAAAWPRG